MRLLSIAPKVLLPKDLSAWHAKDPFFLYFFSYTHVSFEPINKLELFFDCGIPMPEDA
jgi:hypothetical protein